jgi:hypothetical protein
MDHQKKIDGQVSTTVNPAGSPKVWDIAVEPARRTRDAFLADLQKATRKIDKQRSEEKS